MNPDKVLIERFIKEECSTLSITDNPLAENLDGKLIQAGRGEVELSFRVDHSFTQGAGAIQGGIVATMLDFGLAFAALSVVDVTQSVATASIAVNYYRPAFAGHYTVRACIDKQGRTLIFASAELFDTRGKTIAMSNSPLIVVNL